MVTLTKTAVTLYDIATNPQGATNYNTMDTREAEANIRCALELGDTIQEYGTTDRTGRPLRVVLHICTSTDREDLGGVYEIPLNPEPEGNTVTELARHQPQSTTGPIVWVLSSGEDYEGGTVLGVYASKDAAKGPFVEAAKKIPFDLDGAWQNEEDGSVHAHGGCDWVALEPHPLITAVQLS